MACGLHGLKKTVNGDISCCSADAVLMHACFLPHIQPLDRTNDRCGELLRPIRRNYCSALLLSILPLATHRPRLKATRWEVNVGSADGNLTFTIRPTVHPLSTHPRLTRQDILSLILGGTNVIFCKRHSKHISDMLLENEVISSRTVERDLQDVVCRQKRSSQITTTRVTHVRGWASTSHTPRWRNNHRAHQQGAAPSTTRTTGTKALPKMDTTQKQSFLV